MKTTLNLLNSLFNYIVQQKELFCYGILKKNHLWNISKAFFIFILLTAESYSQSNSCQATLKVDHGININSSSPKGTHYLMIITNTGSSTNAYSLTSSNNNATCSNTDGSNTADNVNLNSAFVDINLNPISEITVSSGQSAMFYCHITVPINTTIKKWCCTEVFATSKSCSNYKINTDLHTFYSGPNEEQ